MKEASEREKYIVDVKLDPKKSIFILNNEFINNNNKYDMNNT
jgi:hypothetical protein